MTPRAPNFFHSVAIEINHQDQRWEAVRDEKISKPFRRKGVLFPMPVIEAGDSVSDRAHKVDVYVNTQLHYVPEALDRWQTPQETLDSLAGDCEDYALLKREILRGLGEPVHEEMLYLSLVWDAISRRQHAVLIVDTPNRGFVCLDSFNSLTMPTAIVRDYMPIMTFSGSHCWTHGRRK